jgi:hypothetical protein
MADSRSGIITGTSFTTGVSSTVDIIRTMTITPIITGIGAAASSGPIMVRAASVTGAITAGIIDEAGSLTSH